MKLNSLKSFRPNKAAMILFAAASVGLLAAWGAQRYLAGQMDEMEARTKGVQTGVVVAKAELRRGDKLSSANVAVRMVPSDYAHSGAVAPNQFDRLDGQTLAFAAKPGEMILWSMLEGKKAPTFSARVEAGRRALTVPVDEINSISGMLEPGDVIDLLVSINQKGRKVILPLLQSVQVMATGQRSVDDPRSGERRQYSTVTLDATPEQAKNVIVAREAGKITALLRNPQDKQQSGANVDIAALLDVREDGKPLAASSDQVPVLYGGKSKLPAEGLRLRKYETASNAAPVPAMTNVAPGLPAEDADPDASAARPRAAMPSRADGP